MNIIEGIGSSAVGSMSHALENQVRKFTCCPQIFGALCGCVQVPTLGLLNSYYQKPAGRLDRIASANNLQVTRSQGRIRHFWFGYLKFSNSEKLIT